MHAIDEPKKIDPRPIMEVLQEYAETKIGLKIMEDRLEAMKPTIVQAIESVQSKLKNNLGTFYKTETPVYEFDMETEARIKKLKEEIKKIETSAIAAGKANVKSRTTLFFRPRVERVEE